MPLRPWWDVRVRGPVKVTVGLGVVAAVVGGGLIADAWARDRIEARVLEEASGVLPGLTGAEVEVLGPLVLPQLARGRLDEVRAAAPSVTASGVTLTDVTVVASDVALEPPVAGDLLVVGTAATSEIQGRLPAGLELSLTGSGAFLEITVLTLPLRVGLDVAVADGAAVLAVRELSLAGLALAADDLPDQVADALADIRIDLPEPVPGVVVTGVEVVPGGLRLSATGTDVPLRAAG